MIRQSKYIYIYIEREEVTGKERGRGKKREIDRGGGRDDICSKGVEEREREIDRGGGRDDICSKGAEERER